MIDNGLPAVLDMRLRAAARARPAKILFRPDSLLKSACMMGLLVLLLPALLLLGLVALLVPCFLRVPVCGPPLPSIRSHPRR
jgi:hypothetical protein